MPFTDIQLKNLEIRSTPYRVWEGENDAGFNIQVRPNKTKTFYMFYSLNGKRRFMRLGEYLEKEKRAKDSHPITEAREKLREARHLLNQGIDPQVAKEEAKTLKAQELEEAAQQALEEERMGSLKQLFDYYVEQMKADNKNSWKETQRALYKYALPELGAEAKAKDIKPQNIRRVLFNVIEQGALIQANRLRSYLSASFSYGIKHDLDSKNLNDKVMFNIETNPVRDVPKPQEHEAPGERDLSWDEIRTFWHDVANRYSKKVEIALKLILATGGQRVKEVLSASPDDFNLETRLWEIPNTKNKKTHVIHLNDLSISLVRDLIQEAKSNSSRYLFPLEDSDEEKPMPETSLSQAVSRFCFKEEVLSEEQRKAGIKPSKTEVFKKFTPRDLRRTCKSRMGELGISKEIRDRIQNHALHDVSSKHYDRYDYLPQKRKALDKWGKHLQKIIEGT